MTSAPSRCALCLEHRELRKSHVIPEFLHRPLYDEKHRTMVVEHGASQSAIVQKGLREPLLCADCEQLIGRYERKFQQSWFARASGPFRLGAFVTLAGLDYSNLKLMALSIVWRASVARRNEFGAVDLGPHEDRIREMLLAGQPGPDTKYRVYDGPIVDPETGKVWDGVMLFPVRLRIDGQWAYRMVFGGASWTVVISAGPLSADPVRLRANGTMQTAAVSFETFARATGLPGAVANLDD